jgi:hypothetical protein
VTAAGIEPMSMEEIDAEVVKTVRTEVAGFVETAFRFR